MSGDTAPVVQLFRPVPGLDRRFRHSPGPWPSRSIPSRRICFLSRFSVRCRARYQLRPIGRAMPFRAAANRSPLSHSIHSARPATHSSAYPTWIHPHAPPGGDLGGHRPEEKRRRSLRPKAAHRSDAICNKSPTRQRFASRLAACRTLFQADLSIAHGRGSRETNFAQGCRAGDAIWSGLAGQRRANRRPFGSTS